MPALPEHDHEAIIDEADHQLAVAGLPTYTELAQLLNDMLAEAPGPRTPALAVEALAILHLKMKLDRP